MVSALKSAHPEVFVSISATTRPPRLGEVDGVHYYFVDDAEFDRMLAGGELLEWALVHNQYRYATPRGPVMDALSAGRPAILEIDLQGARQVRTTLPGAQQVFIEPPSWEELVRRLHGRGTENEEQMTRRLETARQELASESEFDVVIRNDTVEDTVAKLVDFMGL
ncbi:guanylate kinase [Brooklawnia cerclae]|uniref:Guanylate kinase n=1 Tax=Brooklawnia cerclae TaxID=349934 RepID=A0ABX0SDS2_9ACTN|nr:guanylate kinase [Brooklawnia cerclae]